MGTNWEKFAKIVKKDVGSVDRKKKSKTIVKSEVVLQIDNEDLVSSDYEHENDKKDSNNNTINHLSIKPTESQEKKIGKYLAIDCEMVGVGPDGIESALARVTIVNLYGHVIIDKYVKPKEKVTDYRTHVSGILPKHLEPQCAHSLEDIQREVAQLFSGRIVIGHAIENDFKALFLSHPYHSIRDTSKFHKFKAIAKSKRPSLRHLCEHFLKRNIQSGSHDSVEDARATMDLYRMVKDEWEAHIRKIKVSKINKLTGGKSKKAKSNSK